MRLNKAIKRFVQTYFRDETEMQHMLKVDRPAVQYAWSLYMSAMRRHGEITETWAFPW